jgi:hypothetical protein
MTDASEQTTIGLEDVLLHVAHARDMYPGGLPLSEMQEAEQRALADLPESSSCPCWGNATAAIAFIVAGTADVQPFSGSSGVLLQAIIEKGMRKSVADVAVFFEADVHRHGLPETARHLILFGTTLMPDAGLAASGGIAASSVSAGESLETERGVTLQTFSVADILQMPARKKEFWQALQQFLARIHA